jgi:hypothetical protein
MPAEAMSEGHPKRARRGTWIGSDTLLTQSGTIIGSCSLM